MQIVMANEMKPSNKKVVMTRGLVPRGHLGFCHYERSINCHRERSAAI